jgi:hypothetical protein
MRKYHFENLPDRISNLQTANGLTSERQNLLHKAFRYGKGQTKLPDVVGGLLVKECSMEAKDNRGKTPMEVAMRHNTWTPAIQQKLIDNKVSIARLLDIGGTGGEYRANYRMP